MPSTLLGLLQRPEHPHLRFGDEHGRLERPATTPMLLFVYDGFNVRMYAGMRNALSRLTSSST